MLERYKRANDALHPTPEAVARAVSGKKRSERKRRGRWTVIPAVAAVLAVVLLVTGIPGIGGGPVLMDAYALAQPTLPRLPTMPAEPNWDSEAAWEQFSEDYDTYWNAWRDYRDEVPAISEQAGLLDRLNAFTAESTAHILTGGGNQIYSPVSLWFALAMLAETTAGETRQEILGLLGAADTAQLRAWADTLWHRLYTDDGVSALVLGDSVWLNENVSFHQKTVDALAEYYYAASFQVPMGTEEADKALSAWTAEQTRGLIGADGKVLETTAETWAVLASTLYYKSLWTDEFNESRTEPDTFTNADGSVSTVDFMHKTKDANFLRREGYQAARLGLETGSITFVLPDEGVTPASLLADSDFLTGLDIDAEDSIWGEVQWSVPKFDVQSTLKLDAAVKELGISSVFEPEDADFSPLCEGTLWLDQIRQIARVKIDEKGVEAAAVTLLASAGAGQPPEDPQICIMDLERPFLFVIQEQGVILFVGIVETL